MVLLRKNLSDLMPSSVVSSIAYDPLSCTLIITYISGMVYQYKKVPEKVYKELKADSSKRRYLNYHIKRKYEFEKIQ